jgi:hypothetical protein
MEHGAQFSNMKYMLGESPKSAWWLLASGVAMLSFSGFFVHHAEWRPAAGNLVGGIVVVVYSIVRLWPSESSG